MMLTIMGPFSVLVVRRGIWNAHKLCRDGGRGDDDAPHGQVKLGILSFLGNQPFYEQPCMQLTHAVLHGY